MFGALFGDIIGSYYEIHSTKDYDFEFNRESTFTDDSVMTCAVARAILLNGEETSHIRQRAKEYAVQYKQFYSYFPHVGYGNMFSEWAENPQDMQKVRSYGNGGAMRAVPIGYAYDTIEQVLLQAKASCMYTHNCREAVRGAQAVASAVHIAFHGGTKADIKDFMRKFHYNLNFRLRDIKQWYSFDSSTDYSVPPSIAAFLEAEDYESAVRNAVSLGGDADTMACIAGGIAEAYYKSIPKHIEQFCYSRLDYTLKSTATEFCKKYRIDSFR